MIKPPQLLVLQSSAREGSNRKMQNAERSNTAFRAMIAVLFPANASLITLSCDLPTLVVFSYYFLLLIQSHFFIWVFLMKFYIPENKTFLALLFFPSGAGKERGGFTYLKTPKIFHCTCSPLFFLWTGEKGRIKERSNKIRRNTEEKSL